MYISYILDLISFNETFFNTFFLLKKLFALLIVYTRTITWNTAQHDTGKIWIFHETFSFFSCGMLRVYTIVHCTNSHYTKLFKGSYCLRLQTRNSQYFCFNTKHFSLLYNLYEWTFALSILFSISTNVHP